MRPIIFTLFIVMLFAPFHIFADDQPVNVQTSALDKTFFEVGTLKFRFTKFRSKFLKFTNGYIEVEVENISNRHYLK